MKRTINFSSKVSLIILSLVFLFGACKKDEKIVAPPNPDIEFITTVKLIAINISDASDIAYAEWKDLSLDGTGQPDVSNAVLNLKANEVYTVNVEFWDEIVNPAENITPEIEEKGAFHLVCFGIEAGLELTIQKLDLDLNNPALPIGLINEFTTGNLSSGNLNVRLRHQPNSKDGTCAPGSTDANVDFIVNIE